MNRTASIRIKGINIVEIKENLPFLILLSISVISIFVGVVSLNNSDLNDFSTKLFDDYLRSRQDISVFNRYVYVLIHSLKYPVISFLCGTSVLGMVISPLTVAYISFCYGIIAGEFYISFGISGIVFNLFVLLLPTIILILTLIISAKDCIQFSGKIARLCIRDTRAINLYYDFKTFCLKHLFLVLPILLSSFLDTTLFDLFKKYLNI